MFEEKVGGVPLAAVWLGERPLWEPDGRQYPTRSGPSPPKVEFRDLFRDDLHKPRVFLLARRGGNPDDLNHATS